jgi:SAM-dependent methyltransferase
MFGRKSLDWLVVTDAYGEYILRTGADIEPWETVFNRYLYRSRFRDLEAPIVDLGPGRCAFTRQAPNRIIGVDNAPAVVDRFRSEGLDVRLGSAYDLPFEDATVSGVYSCWLLEHLQEPLRCMIEVRRVLRRGGYACFIVPSVESLDRGFYDDYTHIRPFSHASMRQLAEDARFTKHETRYLFWTRGLRRLIPSLGEDRLLRILATMDRVSQHGSRLVNKQNLVFEAWR